MNDLRTIARAAVARLSSVIEARAHSASSANAALDIAQPLVAAFDCLIDKIEALESQVADLKQAR
jgi:hypothetical protein